MNATATIKAINNCTTVEEVNAFLTAEKSSDKPRKTVISACEAKIFSFTPVSEGSDEVVSEGANEVVSEDSNDESAETPAPRAPHSGKPAVVKPSHGGKPKVSAEEERIAKFHNKVIWVTCAEITRFATEFFGKDLKSISTKDYVVTITLKSGTKFEKRGK